MLGYESSYVQLLFCWNTWSKDVSGVDRQFTHSPSIQLTSQLCFKPSSVYPLTTLPPPNSTSWPLAPLAVLCIFSPHLHTRPSTKFLTCFVVIHSCALRTLQILHANNLQSFDFCGFSGPKTIDLVHTVTLSACSSADDPAKLATAALVAPCRDRESVALSGRQALMPVYGT
jgi:hypothetical protein